MGNIINLKEIVDFICNPVCTFWATIFLIIFCVIIPNSSKEYILPHKSILAYKDFLSQKKLLLPIMILSLGLSFFYNCSAVIHDCANIITVLSLLLPVFSSLIVFFGDNNTFDSRKTKTSAHINENIKNALNENKTISSYELYIIVLTLIPCLTQELYDEKLQSILKIDIYGHNFSAEWIVSFFIYFGLIHIFTNLIIVLNNFCTIFNFKPNDK